MRILAYIRRSKESDERTISIDHQRAEITSYIRRSAGMLLSSTITDDGISGGDRERIVRIKERITVLRLEGMVAYHLDRIARDTAAQLDLLAWFGKKKLEMHTVNQGLIRSEQSHEFLSVSVQAMMNEFQRRRAIEHGISTSKRQRDANHRYSRFAPYGYRFLGNDILPEPKEQVTLQVIERFTREGDSATTIARMLVDRRILNRKGTHFSPGSIQRIQRRINNNKNGINIIR